MDWPFTWTDTVFDLILVFGQCDFVRYFFHCLWNCIILGLKITADLVVVEGQCDYISWFSDLTLYF